jgi:hypothetical protein
VPQGRVFDGKAGADAELLASPAASTHRALRQGPPNMAQGAVPFWHAAPLAAAKAAPFARATRVCCFAALLDASGVGWVMRSILVESLHRSPS